MTALLDFPVTSAPVLAVRGESAVVPGTALRLPLSPDAVRLPLDDRCEDCAGTGVMFDGGRHGTDMLVSCGCMGSFAELPPAPRPGTVGHLGTKQWTGSLPSGVGFPGDFATYYVEPDYR